MLKVKEVAKGLISSNIPAAHVSFPSESLTGRIGDEISSEVVHFRNMFLRLSFFMLPNPAWSTSGLESHITVVVKRVTVTGYGLWELVHSVGFLINLYAKQSFQRVWEGIVKLNVRLELL